MKIHERIRKIKRAIGSNITYDVSSSIFKQSGATGEILRLEINDLYNIDLVVKFKGEIEPPFMLRSLVVEHIVSLPLVKSRESRIWFSTYETDNDKLKNVFFSLNDYNSSLLKEYDEDVVDNMKAHIRKLDLNIKVQRKAIKERPIESIANKFNTTMEKAVLLHRMGVTVNGWKHHQEEMYYSKTMTSEEMQNNLQNNIIHREELTMFVGLMELTKKRLRL